MTLSINVAEPPLATCVGAVFPAHEPRAEYSAHETEANARNATITPVTRPVRKRNLMTSSSPRKDERYRSHPPQCLLAFALARGIAAGRGSDSCARVADSHSRRGC